MSVSTDPVKIDELLTRGVHDIFTTEDLKNRLLSGKQLHLKLGTDVTGPNLHLGHTVIQRKLRDFQELGHKVTLIIGDFTTLVGDHSDKVDMRAQTDEAQISQNEQGYRDQFFKTVIKEQTQIRHNSEWLSKLNFRDVLKLAEQFTISQLLERDTFMQRYKQQKPIGLDEFLYPLMQGYDSVVLNCDVEFGGTDQTFNLLAGRRLMPVFGLTPQCAMVLKLLTGSDGRPMGKSLQNFIPVGDSAINMYGKLMSIVDEVIFDYFELCTRVPMTDIAKMKQEVAGGANPMGIKKQLALEISTFYHGSNQAQTAQQVFETTVQNKELSKELIVDVPNPGQVTILDFLKTALPQATASAEIKRTITQGGVEVNGVKVTDFTHVLAFNQSDIIKFGKRVFLKIL